MHFNSLKYTNIYVEIITSRSVGEDSNNCFFPFIIKFIPFLLIIRFRCTLLNISSLENLLNHQTAAYCVGYFNLPRNTNYNTLFMLKASIYSALRDRHVVQETFVIWDKFQNHHYLAVGVSICLSQTICFDDRWWFWTEYGYISICFWFR